MPRFLRFGGRIGRLAYFAYSCALGIGMTFIFMLVGLVAAAASGGQPINLLRIPLPMLALGVTAGVVGLWSGLALTAQRLRDLGLPPLPIFGLALAFGFFDYFALTGLLSGMGWRLTGGASPAGMVVNLIATLGLLFIPGGAFEDDGGGDADAVPAQAPVGRSPTAALVDRQQPRAQFGLRGR